MPTDERSENPDAAAAAYWRSVAAMSAAAEREAAVAREVERDVEAPAGEEREAERAAVTRGAAAARRTRPHL